MVGVKQPLPLSGLHSLVTFYTLSNGLYHQQNKVMGKLDFQALITHNSIRKNILAHQCHGLQEICAYEACDNTTLYMCINVQKRICLQAAQKGCMACISDRLQERSIWQGWSNVTFQYFLKEYTFHYQISKFGSAT